MACPLGFVYTLTHRTRERAHRGITLRVRLNLSTVSTLPCGGRAGQDPPTRQDGRRLSDYRAFNEHRAPGDTRGTPQNWSTAYFQLGVFFVFVRASHHLQQYTHLFFHSWERRGM